MKRSRRAVRGNGKSNGTAIYAPAFVPFAGDLVSLSCVRKLRPGHSMNVRRPRPQIAIALTLGGLRVVAETANVQQEFVVVTAEPDVARNQILQVWEKRFPECRRGL